MARSSANSSAAYPVHALREQATALEAAIALVMVKPRKKPVHQLRTSTRRIEAILELLCLLEARTASLRGFSKSTRKLKKLLAKVRKSAGKVRDLDVQRDLIKNLLNDSARQRVRQDARHLRRTLKAHRTSEAAALLAELEGHARKLAPRLEAMLESLEPSADLSLSASGLTRLIRSWYTTHTEASGSSEKALHGIRKAAKLARYMAEVGDTSMSTGFENTQQLGGTWHDALTLRTVAKHHLGQRADLVEILGHQEQAALRQYRNCLGLATEAEA